MSSLFSFIKAQVPIVSEVGRYVRLRSAGSYYKGPCPFHKETDASFTVSPDKGIFYCFGCHATGDVIGFIAKVENIGPLEAAKQLADAHGLKIPDELLHSMGSSGKQSEEKASYFAVHKMAAVWAHHQLRANAHAYQYVLSRGISEQMIDVFMIGFFPSGPRGISALLSGAMKENMLAKDFIEAGIFYESGKSQLRSPFEDRILFPITDAMGRYCGFGGRVFVAQDDRAKYYNSKESPFFLKGALLFGYSAAKKAMQERKAVFLVEGYTDCVMMAQAGYGNVVATLGTACTKEHLQILARSVETIYVLYDGDAAGKKAMLRLAHLCWQVNVELQVITLPSGLDPAAYLVKYGTLSEMMASARDIFTFFVSANADEFATKNLAEKMRIIEEVLEVIGKVGDVVKRELLLQQLSSSISMPLSALRLKLQEQGGTPVAKEVIARTAPASPAAEGTGNTVDVLEEQIVALYVNSAVRGESFTLSDDVVCTLSPDAQKVCAVVAGRQAGIVGTELFQKIKEALGRDEQAQWLVRATTTYAGIVSEQEFATLVGKLIQSRWKDMVVHMRERIAQASASGDTGKVEELLSTFAHWKEQMQQKGHMLWQKK